MKSRKGSFSRNVYILLVLFITLLFSGGALYCYLWSGILGEQAQEDVLYLAECKEGASVQDILELKTELERNKEFKSIEYISPERTATILVEEDLLAIGEEDVLDIALPAFLAIRLESQVYEQQRGTALLLEVKEHPLILDIFTQPELLSSIQENLKKIGRVLAIVAFGIGLISIFLLSSIIKLSLYADRTEIKTMQLTGATPGYIRRPYVKRYLFLAFIAGLSACLVLVIIHLNLTNFVLPGSEGLLNWGILASTLTGLGMLLAGWVTFRLVNKYIFADIASLF